VGIRIRALLLAVVLAVTPGAVLAHQAQPSTQAPTQPPSAADRATPATSDNVRVWVNTASGVYHCPGTRWYGKTKSGQYLTQKEALQKGYRAAYHKPCK